MNRENMDQEYNQGGSWGGGGGGGQSPLVWLTNHHNLHVRSDDKRARVLSDSTWAILATCSIIM